jgi:hypothetical protein
MPSYIRLQAARKYAGYAVVAAIACVGAYYLLFMPLGDVVFDPDESHAFPYLYGIALLYYGVLQGIFYIADITLTYFLVARCRRRWVNIGAMTALFAAFNSVAFLGVYADLTWHGDFSIFLRGYITWTFLPTVLFLHLQVVVYAFAFRGIDGKNRGA